MLSRYFAQLADKRIRRRWDFFATDITLTVQLNLLFWVSRPPTSKRKDLQTFRRGLKLLILYLLTCLIPVGKLPSKVSLSAAVGRLLAAELACVSRCMKPIDNIVHRCKTSSCFTAASVLQRKKIKWQASSWQMILSPSQRSAKRLMKQYLCVTAILRKRALANHR